MLLGIWGFGETFFQGALNLVGGLQEEKGWRSTAYSVRQKTFTLGSIV